MHNLFSDFSESFKEDWIAQLTKDLKGKSIEEALHIKDEIEDIEWSAFQYSSDYKGDQSHPGNFPFERGGSAKDNHWDTVCVIQHSDAKTMNGKALKALMNGSDNVDIDLAGLSNEEIKTALNGIEFQYIRSSITYHNDQQLSFLLELLEDVPVENLSLIPSNENLKRSVAHRNVLINAYKVHETGGNASQEIAYALHKGHEALFDLIKNGTEINNALSQFKFRFGIGSNYFLEICKFRVFRSLWSQIVFGYTSNTTAILPVFVEARTGNINKSLQDPYTNLLRQTTEAMSAVIGGIDELSILPYSFRSQGSDDNKAQRLATNISLILKEEAFLSHVVDATGGAYNLEKLTNRLVAKSWALFLSLEKEGLNYLKKEIAKTAELRIQKFQNNELTLIGINKYFNPEKVAINWNERIENELGSELILERDVQLESAEK